MSQDNLKDDPSQGKKEKDNDNSKEEKAQLPKLDYNRDWSAIGRNEAIAFLRGICTSSDDPENKLADGSVVNYMKIQLQAAIIGVHGLVQTYGLEEGKLDLQFLHIPAVSRARQMVVQCKDELEDRYQRQQSQ